MARPQCWKGPNIPRTNTGFGFLVICTSTHGVLITYRVSSIESLYGILRGVALTSCSLGRTFYKQVCQNSNFKKAKIPKFFFKGIGISRRYAHLHVVLGLHYLQSLIKFCVEQFGRRTCANTLSITAFNKCPSLKVQKFPEK